MSDQTYQSAFGESGPSRDSWNHGCSLEVWFITKSVITRIPRSCADSTNDANSSTVPNSGLTVRKSEMS